MGVWRRAFPLRLRSRRSWESTFFISTFAAAVVTVSLSASTLLPCPAHERGARTESRETMAPTTPSTRTPVARPDREALPVGGLGQKALLTRRDGWIDIDERPPLLSWRRWAS